MYPRSLPFSTIPHSSQLYLDYLTHFGNVARFYARPPFARDWFAAQAKAAALPADRRNIVCSVLERQNRSFGASAAALANIERLRAGAAAVVTGQQVTLFGGPLYSLLKAVTAIKLAEESTAAGVPAVPVFWLASEDHDLHEANHVQFLSADGEVRRLVTETAGTEHAQVGSVRFGQEIESVVAQAAALLGDTHATDALRASYRPGETFASAFAKLYATLFADFGLVLIDSSDAELHAVSAPVLQQAAARARELCDRLLQRNQELEAAGYHAQVMVTAQHSLLFAMKDGARTPVQQADGHFSIGRERVAREAFVQRVASEPERFSANVLLRPVMQDYLLPTLAYVGGPAEVAYLAQAAVVYEELLGRVTPVLPRASATLVDARSARLLEKYGLDLPELFHGEDHVRDWVAARNLPEHLHGRMADSATQVEASLASLKSELERLDPTVLRSASKTMTRIRQQWERLERRTARALLQKDALLKTHAQRLSSTLFPHKNLQERELGGICFLARHGSGLLSELKEKLSTASPDHQVIRAGS